MKKLFNTIKNATASITKNLFSSKENQQNQQEQPQQEISPEEQIHQFDEYIKSYLDKNKELKIKILTNRKYFNDAVIQLSWKKILDLKVLYANERRINFQPKLVVLEIQHQERILLQVAELIQKYYDIQIFYDKQELMKQIKLKVLEEQCTKILFSKEELKDYFLFFETSEIHLSDLKQLFPNMILEFSHQYLLDIQRQYLIDRAYEIYKFDDCDEMKAIRLFQDDKEVLKWVKRKQTLTP